MPKFNKYDTTWSAIHGENSNNSLGPPLALFPVCLLERLAELPAFARVRNSRNIALASSFSGPGYSNSLEQNL